MRSQDALLGVLHAVVRGFMDVDQLVLADGEAAVPATAALAAAAGSVPPSRAAAPLLALVLRVITRVRLMVIGNELCFETALIKPFQCCRTSI